MKSAILMFASSILLGVSIGAVAGEDGGMPCKQIKARASFSDFEFQTPCVKYPGYDWCWVGVPLKGPTKGTWDGYGQWDWIIGDVHAAGLPSWESSGYYQRNYDVFITKHGEIQVESLFVVDGRIGGASMSPVVGGTGIFEDASGVVAAFSFDPDAVLWKVKGEVCGPFIPIEEDDDDSDSD